MTCQKTLSIAEAYDNDIGRGIARLDPSTVVDLNISVGDVCLVGDDWKCPVKVWRADREDWDSGEVLLDEYTRISIQTDVGETVTVKPTKPITAERIILNQYMGLSFDFAPDAIELLKRQWVERPVSIGDIIPAVTEGDDTDPMPFVIADIQPDDVCVIKHKTEIIINTD